MAVGSVGMCPIQFLILVTCVFSPFIFSVSVEAYKVFKLFQRINILIYWLYPLFSCFNFIDFWFLLVPWFYCLWIYIALLLLVSWDKNLDSICFLCLLFFFSLFSSSSGSLAHFFKGCCLDSFTMFFRVLLCRAFLVPGLGVTKCSIDGTYYHLPVSSFITLSDIWRYKA